jgi:hypothetical protein
MNPYNKLSTPSTPYGDMLPPDFVAPDELEKLYETRKETWNKLHFPVSRLVFGGCGKAIPNDTRGKKICRWIVWLLFWPVFIAIDLVVLGLFYAAALVTVLPFSIAFGFARCCGHLADRPNKRFVIHFTKATLIVMALLTLALWIALIVLAPSATFVFIPSVGGAAAARRKTAAADAAAAATTTTTTTPIDEKTPITAV